MGEQAEDGKGRRVGGPPMFMRELEKEEPVEEARTVTEASQKQRQEREGSLVHSSQC